MDDPLRVGREPDDPQHYASRRPAVSLRLFYSGRLYGHLNLRVPVIGPDCLLVYLENIQGGERPNGLVQLGMYQLDKGSGN